MTGLRHCGKSTLLIQYQTWLTASGVTNAQILSVNFEELEYVDFVAEKQGEYTYYQVTADMRSQETFVREMRPLTLIRNNYEKVVLTAAPLTARNYNGIRVKNLLDWLLEKDK